MTDEKILSINHLTGREKAAVLLITLGTDTAGKVMKHFSDDEIEAIAYEIARIDKVPSDVREKVMEEFASIATAQKYASQGGLNYAQKILEQAMGSQQAVDIMSRLSSSMQTRPFEVLRKMDPEHINDFLQGEHPQTIALILSYLQPEQSAAVLRSLPEEQQVDVARRLAVMNRTSPAIVQQLETLLEHKFSNLMSQDYTKAGGVDSLVEILNRVDRGTEKVILGQLDNSDEDLATEIRNELFTFDDLANLDDRALQRLLREVDMQEDLPMALKASSDEVKETILNNVSQRAQEALKEDMEYLGPVRLSMVEDAQQEVVNIARQLEDEGEIVLARGREDSMVV